MSIYSGPNPNLRNRPNGVPNLAVPEGSPSLYIDFVNNNCATVNNGIKTASSNAMSLITFTRSSNATYTAANGTIQYVTNNVPRFDYDSTTGYCKGLLIEEQRTNLIYPSIPSSSIGKYACTVATNTTDTLSPDGTYNSSKVSLTGINSFIYWNYSVAANSTPVTHSVYLKAGSITRLTIGVADGPSANAAFATIELSNGQIVFTGTGYYGGTYISSNAQNMNNGWYKINLSGSIAFTSINFYIYDYTGPVTTTSSGYYYVWGGQAETGSFATSLIPTTTSTATRVDEYVQITGTNLTSWFNPNAGTFYAKFLSTSPYNERILNSNNDPTKDIISNEGVMGNGTYFSYIGSISAVSNNTVRVAVATSITEGAGSFNGSTAVATGACSYYSTISSYPLCILGGGAPNRQNWVKQISYWPVRIANTSLQQITT